MSEYSFDETTALIKEAFGVDKLRDEVVPAEGQLWKCLKCGKDVPLPEVRVECGIRPLSWLCWCRACHTAEGKRLKDVCGWGEGIGTKMAAQFAEGFDRRTK